MSLEKKEIRCQGLGELKSSFILLYGPDNVDWKHCIFNDWTVSILGGRGYEK